MDGVVKVRLTRSCELRLAGKIYHQGDVMEVDVAQLAQLGDMVLRIEEQEQALEYLRTAGFTADQAMQALPGALALAQVEPEPPAPKKRAKK